MTHGLPPGDDPTAPHDPDKWMGAEADREVPADLQDEDVDEAYLAEEEPGERTKEAASQG
jgi:hypothetical protein